MVFAEDFSILCIRHTTNDTVQSITACSSVSGWVKSLWLRFFGNLVRISYPILSYLIVVLKQQTVSKLEQTSLS